MKVSSINDYTTFTKECYPMPKIHGKLDWKQKIN